METIVAADDFLGYPRSDDTVDWQVQGFETVELTRETEYFIY